MKNDKASLWNATQLLCSLWITRSAIGINVARGVKVIGRRDEGARKIMPPSKEAMRALLAVADQDFRVKLAFASATGVRAGELHALRWHHFDLVKGEVKIETRVDAYGEEDVTKTAAGMRVIPVAQPLVLMLKEWKLRTKRKKAGDLVFPSRRGWYTGHDNMIKRKFLPLFDRLAANHKRTRRSIPDRPRGSIGMH